MAEQSKIAWTDSAVNFWSGCAKVSPGCANCYAEELSKRFSGPRISVLPGSKRDKPAFGQWGKGAPRRLHESAFKLAHKLNRKPWVCGLCGEGFREKGVLHDASDKVDKDGNAVSYIHRYDDSRLQESFHRRRIFSLSLGDWLDPEVPIAWLARMLDTVRKCSDVDWLLCSKRTELWEARLRLALNYIAKAASTGYCCEHDESEKRNTSLRRSEDRRTSNRQARSSMARDEANIRPMDKGDKDNTVQSCAGRNKNSDGIHASQGDAEREAILRSSAPSRVASLQRNNPIESDGQPQERKQVRQLSEQSGTGNLHGTDSTLIQSAGDETRGREGAEPSQDQVERRRRYKDALAEKERRHGEGHCKGLFDESKSGQPHTSRAYLEALAEWIRNWLAGTPPSHIVILTSVENQQAADQRIPELLRIPAARRGLSCEPLLGPVDLSPWLAQLDWVIIGGES